MDDERSTQREGQGSTQAGEEATMSDTAKAEGQATYAAGVPLDDNPYGYLSDMRPLMWRAGWLEGFQAEIANKPKEDPHAR
jgi:hypothetical protein